MFTGSHDRDEPVNLAGAVLLIAAAVAGGAAAGVYLRRERERMREAMKAISLDVLSQTGDSLAQRLADARRAEEERAAGEMARRSEEIKGLVGPVQERLGRMESEIGRLERERREAQGELAQMVRQLGDGRGHAAPGDRQPRVRAEATRPRAGPGARSSCATSSRWRGWSPTATSSSRHTISTAEGMLRPDMLVRLPGGKLVVVDSKVPLDAYLLSLEATSEDQRELHGARHARQTREHIAKLASKGYQRQFDSRPSSS